MFRATTPLELSTSISPSLSPARTLKIHGTTIADPGEPESSRCERVERDPLTNLYVRHTSVIVHRDAWAGSQDASEGDWQTRCVGNLIVADRYTFFG